MAQRFEWYSGPMNEVTKMYEPFWKGQSFTPQVTHKITAVRLYCYRVYSALSFKLTADIYVAPDDVQLMLTLAILTYQNNHTLDIRKLRGVENND